MGLLAAVAWLAGPAAAAEMPSLQPAGGVGQGTVAVVEMFTSEGCAECPPANALLARLAEEPGVIALSVPVDYWNYLGWKDTRATPENSARQMAYAAARRDRAVFTPQAVINGRTQVVGSDEQAIRAEIDRQSVEGRAPGVPIDVARGGETGEVLEIRIGAAPEGMAERAGTIWVAAVEPSAAVNVLRGENAGREVTYRNIVRKMQAVDMWWGEPRSIDLPAQEIEGCVLVIVQAERGNKPGPILGAAFLP
jgi:hypothetical protein